MTLEQKKRLEKLVDDIRETSYNWGRWGVQIDGDENVIKKWKEELIILATENEE